jgi:hypothetical protein
LYLHPNIFTGENMTQDEIIEMARDADLVTWLNTSKRFNSGCWWIEAHEPDDCLFKFAKLVAQHEREACAKVCDDHCGWTPRMIGSTIRARGSHD